MGDRAQCSVLDPCDAGTLPVYELHPAENSISNCCASFRKLLVAPVSTRAHTFLSYMFWSAPKSVAYVRSIRYHSFWDIGYRAFLRVAGSIILCLIGLSLYRRTRSYLLVPDPLLSLGMRVLGKWLISSGFDMTFGA